MAARIVHRPALRLIGPSVRVPLIHEGVNPHIAEFIKGLGAETVERITALTGEDPLGIVSVTDDFSPNREEGSELDYWHAVVAREDAVVPEDLEVLRVPAGTWAVFTNTGPFPHALQKMWGDTYSQWFPSNPYETRPGPEILRTRFIPGTGDAEAELWMPVTRTARG